MLTEEKGKMETSKRGEDAAGIYASSEGMLCFSELNHHNPSGDEG